MQRKNATIEARAMLADPSGRYWTSSRACRYWTSSRACRAWLAR